jgi:GT2 family glycosyltransferase
MDLTPVPDDGRATPTLSVVIPTYQRPDTLAQCLDRLAPGMQSLDAARYEVIVSDDSTDETSRRMVADRYPWALWTAGPRRGPAANRNAGARLARASYLVFTDDDCLPDPNWLSGFLVAVARGWEISPGRTVCRQPWTSPLQISPVNETGAWIWSCNFLIRRSAFEQFGGFDERFPHAHMEDFDLQQRAREGGLVEGFSSEAIVDHPPRRLAWGGALARQHYSAVLYAAIHRETLPLILLLRRVVLTRLRAIRERPVLVDGCSALASLVAEAWHILWHFRAWQQQAHRVVRG